jgi:hypothetical protein
MIPVSPTGLYWSIRGNVACAEHANDILQARWVSEGWAALPETSQGFHGRMYQCEFCSPKRTAIYHPTGGASAFTQP